MTTDGAPVARFASEPRELEERVDILGLPDRGPSESDALASIVRNERLATAAPLAGFVIAVVGTNVSEGGGGSGGGGGGGSGGGGAGVPPTAANASTRPHP